MGAYYDEIEIEDMAWDDEKRVFHYPCPCGDRFEISRGQLANYEDVATCPSCSLIIRVIYDPVRGLHIVFHQDTDRWLSRRSWTLRTSPLTRKGMMLLLRVRRKRKRIAPIATRRSLSKMRWRA